MDINSTPALKRLYDYMQGYEDGKDVDIGVLCDRVDSAIEDLLQIINNLTGQK